MPRRRSRGFEAPALLTAALIAALAVAAAAVILGCGDTPAASEMPTWLEIRLSAGPAAPGDPPPPSRVVSPGETLRLGFADFSMPHARAKLGRPMALA